MLAVNPRTICQFFMLCMSLWLSVFLPASLAFASDHQSANAELPLHDDGTLNFSEQAQLWEKHYQTLQADAFPESELNLALLQLNQVLTQLKLSYFVVYQGPNHWQTDVLRYEKQLSAYKNLLTIRQNLLLQLQTQQRQRVMSFGPEGIRQLLVELNVFKLNMQLLVQYDLKKLSHFVEDMMLSPMPLIGAFLEVIILSVLFVLWQRRWLNMVMSTLTALVENKGDGSLKPLSQLLSFYQSIHRAFEYGAFAYLLLAVTLAVFSAVHQSLILSVFLALWGLRVLLSISDYFMQHMNPKVHKLIRLSIHKSCVLLLIYFIGSSLLDFYHINDAVLAHDFFTLWSWSSLLFVVYLLKLWRGFMFELIESEDFEDNRLLPLLDKSRTGVRSLILVLIAVLYFPVLALIRRCVQWASRYETVNLWLTYLFRVEVARQHAKTLDGENLESFPEDACQPYQLDYVPEVYVANIADDLQKQIETFALAGKSSTCLIHAPKGAGKSVFIRQLMALDSLKEQQIDSLLVNCPRGGFSGLMESLAVHMALHETLTEGEDLNSARDVVNALKDMPKTLICIDDIHHLVNPSIGGLQELDRLVRLIRRASSNITWVLTLDSASWSFVERARGERFLFDIEQSLPKWSDEHIAELIQQRIEEHDLQLDLSHMVFPKQLNQSTDHSEEAAIVRYASILWEYSSGNPGVALQLWQQSLFQLDDKKEAPIPSQQSAILRLFDLSESDALSNLSVTLLLILRAIMQMEYAQKDAIAQSANVSSDEVIDALRLLSSKGFVCKNDSNEYSIHWPSYRDVATVLSRQHLLVV